MIETKCHYAEKIKKKDVWLCDSLEFSDGRWWVPLKVLVQIEIMGNLNFWL